MKMQFYLKHPSHAFHNVLKFNPLLQETIRSRSLWLQKICAHVKIWYIYGILNWEPAAQFQNSLFFISQKVFVLKYCFQTDLLLIRFDTAY